MTIQVQISGVGQSTMFVIELRFFQIVVCFKAGESFLPNDMQEQ